MIKQSITKSCQFRLLKTSQALVPPFFAIISCSQFCKFPIHFLPNGGIFLKCTFNHFTPCSKTLQWSCIFLKKQVQAPQSGPYLPLQHLLSSPLSLITLAIYATAWVQYFRFPANAVLSHHAAFTHTLPRAPNTSVSSHLSHGELFFILQYPCNLTPKVYN